MAWVAQGSGLSNIVEDTTPQLGGNLDVNGKTITSASDGDVTVTPNGTGDLILDGLKWPQADGSAEGILFTDGSAQIAFQAVGLFPTAEVGTATYRTLQQHLSVFHSAGVVTGGGVTDDTDGTITVAAGTGFIRATNSAVAELLSFDWSAEAGANVNLADDDMNYIYIEYNSGSPQAIATTTKRTDENTNVYLGSIYRNGTDLHPYSQHLCTCRRSRIEHD